MPAADVRGVPPPTHAPGAICRERKVFFHTDAAQAAGKIPLDVDAMQIDLMSLSGHKLYGPKGMHTPAPGPCTSSARATLTLAGAGVGALYTRRRPRVRLEALQSGGGQERGIRSGTVPTPLVVGLGAACKVAREEMTHDHAKVCALSDRLVRGITSRLSHVTRNGDPVNGYPGPPARARVRAARRWVAAGLTLVVWWCACVRRRLCEPLICVR
jgi:cysteine desulfurase